MTNNQEAKKRYNDKLYDEADFIRCGCGCGQELKSVDHYGRKRTFINGHNNKKYDNPTQYKREWNHRNKKARSEYRTKYVEKRKNDMILFKGGKCVNCGIEYNGLNQPIFDFHHIDPTKKEIRLNKAKIDCISIKKLYTELEKCDLLCSNCHRMLHFGKEK